MADALTALEVIIANVSALAEAVAHTRGKSVPPDKVRSTVKVIALTYYEAVHTELESVQHRAGLVGEIDFVLKTLLELASTAREKSAYLGQIKELRPYLSEALIDMMKARGTPRLVLSRTEKAILETVGKLLPTTAASYEQVLRDIAEGRRVSWRGCGAELREVLREVMDHLAPDGQVMAAPGFQLEDDLKRPTQKQKVRFILKARKSGRKGTSTAVPEESLNTFDEALASLGRSTYQRGSVSTHADTDALEIRKLKGYVDALLVELLEISG